MPPVDRTLPGGNPQARRIGDEALDAFAATLGPVAAERFEATYGPDWRRTAGFAADGIGARTVRIDDPQELLGRLQDSPQFDKVFRPLLRTGIAPFTAFALARELKEERNTLYHRSRRWEGGDAWRLVDRVQRLLDVLGLVTPDVASHLERLAGEAARIVSEGAFEDLQSLRAEYAERILLQTSSVDVAGISASLGSRVVRVRLEDVFVEPELRPFPDPEDETPGLGLDDLLLTRRAVLLAGPGAGKSTLLRRVARTLALAESRATTGTPVLVSAREVADALDSEPSLTFRRFLTRRYSDRFGDLLASELALGRLVVLVDGLDEVAAQASRAVVASRIGQFTHEYPATTLLATSRVIGFSPPPSWASFAQFALAPFDDERIEAFARKWLEILGESEVGDPRELIEAIKSSSGARELAGTPLLLTILILLWHRGATLPARLAELYDVATTTLLRDWPSRRLGHHFDDRQLLTFLRPAAYQLIDQGRASIGERALLSAWAAIFADLESLPSHEAALRRAEELVHLIEEQTGVFVEIGREGGERQFAFIHKSFAEFIAARQLAEDWDADKLRLEPHLHVLRWYPTVDFLGGLMGIRGRAAATALAQAILSAATRSERYLNRNRWLVLRLMSQGMEIDPKLRDEILTAGITDLLDPGLEALMTRRASIAVDVARRTPRVVTDGATEARPDDDPVVLAKKAWLKVLVAPSEDAISALVARATALLAVFDGSDALRTAMRSAGAQEVDQAEANGLYLRLAGDWLVLDLATRDLLAKSGIPSYGLAEVAKASASLLADDQLWMFEPSSYELGSVADLVALLEHGDAYWPLLVTTFDIDGWHDSRVGEIDALMQSLDTLAPGVARFAMDAGLADFNVARAAWQGVVIGLIQGGRPETSQEALILYLLMDFGASEENAAWVAELANDPANAFAARAVAIAWPQMDVASSAPYEPLCRTIATNHPDAVARGLARRALAFALDEPLKILSSPDVVFSSSVYQKRVYDMTAELVSILMMLPRGEQQDAAAELTRRILSEAYIVAYDLGGGELVDAPPFARLAAELAVHEDAGQRAWGAMILRSVERTPAPQIISALLGDDNEIVRQFAVDAIQDVDLRDPSWLEDALVKFFAVERGDLSEEFAVQLCSRLPAEVIEELVPIAEAYLDDHSGAPPALFMLDAAGMTAAT